MTLTVVVTGASAGNGRAIARAFADAGCDVGLLARDPERLATAVSEVQARGQRGHAVPTDVADAAAVERAADEIERELGPIDVWVNNAMATIFAPVSEIAPDEFRRATEVSYLGFVHGTMAALKRMRARGRGSIVQVGSALSYRAIPLQAAYCGAKFAIRGFTDSLRTELMHEGLPISICMVQLPAVNTPQFDWALSRMPRKARPVPPVFQPELVGKTVVYAAFHPRREIWLGYPTWKAILGTILAPALADRMLARSGFDSQQREQPTAPDPKANLFEAVPGRQAAHGSFDREASRGEMALWAIKNRNVLAAVGVLGALCLGAACGRRRI